MTSPALSIDALDAAIEALPAGALSGARRAALENLRRTGMPGVREEDWKYTDLAPLVTIANAWLDQGAALPEPGAVEALPEIDAHWIRIGNGQIDDDSLAGLPAGVTVRRLSDTAGDIAPAGRLGDLNVALLHDGLQIHVEKGVVVQRPIGIATFDSAFATSVSQVRVDIDLAPGSSASFVEYQASAGEADLFANAVVSLSVAAGALADYVRIQERQRHHNQTSYLAVSLGRDARLQHASFDIGGHLVRNDLVVDLANPGSTAEFGGLYLVGDGQHIDNHTRVDHRVGPAVSNQEYRGILDGKARGVWNGKAIVHEGADGTDAQQSNHNLLLSEKAEINAKPELEIYADDVKCSHGTTVGQLDETALFYLRTRGLARRDARRMLTRAFAQATISRSPIEALHEYLALAVDTRLRELMHEGES